MLRFVCYGGIPLIGLIVLASCIRSEGAARNMTPVDIASNVMFAETVFDAGDVARGAAVSHEFVLENRGKSAIRLGRIDKSCTCVAAEVRDAVVPPGRTGSVLVTLDTAQSGGLRTATVEVFDDLTNPARSCGTLAVVARIRFDWFATFDPATIDVGDLDESGPLIARTHLVWHSDPATPTGAIRLEPDADRAFLAASLDLDRAEVVEEKGKTVQGEFIPIVRRVTIPAQIRVAARLRPGPLSDSFAMRVVTQNGSRQLPIGLTGRVVAAVEANPERVVFHLPEEISHSVHVSISTPEAIDARELEFESNDPSLQGRIEAQDARRCRLSLKLLDASAFPEGYSAAEIRLLFKPRVVRRVPVVIVKNK